MDLEKIDKELDKLFLHIQTVEIDEDKNNLLTENIITLIKEYFRFL